MLVTITASANAALFRFHDYSENPDAAWLTVDGTTVTTDGLYGGGSISGFSVSAYDTTLDQGERISFDYQPASYVGGSQIIYTQLLEPAAGNGTMISDEFLAWTSGDGVYHVDFVSSDTANPLMASLHPTLQLPTATVLNELPAWQLMGTIGNDTFEAMSAIPEPGTFAGAASMFGLVAVVVGGKKRSKMS